MNLDLPHMPGHGGSNRRSNGCWTCRLRRKKCDELHPVCSTCSSLRITCYYDEKKPEWMDGATKQEEMVQRFKREVKDKARHRYEILPTQEPGDDSIVVNDSPEQMTMQTMVRNTDVSSSDIPEANSKYYGGDMELRQDRDPDKHSCTSSRNGAGNITAFQKSDSLLVMFYIDQMLPFLFPFYNPPLLQGGKAWILDLMITSPVYRRASLCQSSYFFSLSQSLPAGNAMFETLLRQSRAAFEVLRQALSVIDGPRITEHLHGAVRILASILQLQRFETTILSFGNCQSHLNAALALFGQLLDSSEVEGCPSARFRDIINRLGPSPWMLPERCKKVLSAEQAAFKFSTAQLILDDIIASTALQEEPKLYNSHQNMLGPVDGLDLVVNLEDTIGCQNWVLIEISNIAALDAWKQRGKACGSLDVMELVSRATAIKDSLQDGMMGLEIDQGVFSERMESASDPFTADFGQQPRVPMCQLSVVTRVWSHAALIYLFVVVSGWQSANDDVRYHVGQVVELLKTQLSLPTLIRAMAWPFCIAGCLAEAGFEASFREMVDPLRPSNVFGTVRKALEIMEKVWHTRDENFVNGLDLSTLFTSHGQLVLLV